MDDDLLDYNDEVTLTIDDINQMEKEVLDLMIGEAREDFYTFVRLMAPTVLPDEFTDGRHIYLICKELQDIAASVTDKSRDPGRLQLFLPPGSMKSKLASNLFPAWCLGKHPNWCFLAIGSDFDFSVDNFGRPTKDLVDSAPYQAIFPHTVLKKDVQSAGRWDTTKKGRFVARGAGQNIAGRRAHISIVDDALTEQTTDIERKKINGWYRKGLRTRLLPRGAEIIINTRWHIDDLSGFMSKIDGVMGVDEKTSRPWKVISIPALLDETASKYLLRGLPEDEERFAVGTSFWPEFWPTGLLQEKRDGMDPSEWLALYMQTPIAEEGAIIKRNQFKIWDQEDPPKCKFITVSMDTAFSVKESADYSAYSVWGVFTNEEKSFEGVSAMVESLILLSAGRGRWDFAELCNKSQEVNSKYTPDFFIIEDRASGQSLIYELRKRGLPIMAYMPEKDKNFRLQATTPYFQAGRIYIPEGKEWAEELVSEVISFPKAPNDDYVDTVSQAILWMRDASMIDNDGFHNKNDYEDDEPYWNVQRRTYWSALTN